MASNSDHMEYSTWRIFGVLWSASGSTPFDYIYCHMEYSIRSLFDAIWSTPCGHYFLPYGVLHIIAIPVNFGRNGKSSITLIFNALRVRQNREKSVFLHCLFSTKRHFCKKVRESVLFFLTTFSN